MTIKEDEVTIKEGAKGKFQLKFAPFMYKDEKAYYLYVDREGEPWECIQVIATYT